MLWKSLSFCGLLNCLAGQGFVDVFAHVKRHTCKNNDKSAMVCLTVTAL